MLLTECRTTQGKGTIKAGWIEGLNQLFSSLVTSCRCVFPWCSVWLDQSKFWGSKGVCRWKCLVCDFPEPVLTACLARTESSEPAFHPFASLSVWVSRLSRLMAAYSATVAMVMVMVAGYLWLIWFSWTVSLWSPNVKPRWLWFMTFPWDFIMFLFSK